MRIKELERDVRELRCMLAGAYSGVSLYRDDGELQDGRQAPIIDFRRDDVDVIAQKMRARSMAEMFKVQLMGKFPEQPTFDLISHLHRQRSFSATTFGPGLRADGVLDHIRKELKEIEADPTDVTEWIDVVILAFDGAWRQGWSPEDIAKALEAKQTKNESRKWPDWRNAEPGKAIEHDRSGELS
jgi:hypothetical protein